MARDNGGIIGPVNDPTSTTASGVWSLEEQYQAQLAGNWPSAPAPFSTNSLRFDSGSSDYLVRTPSSDGSRRTWTWSAWVKRSTISAYQYLFINDTTAVNGNVSIRFENTDKLGIYLGQTTGQELFTDMLFRDVSAWYHIVLAVDTTQSTADDRRKLYVNGSAVTFSSSGTLSQNADLNINTTSDPAHIGGISSYYFDGYMSEVILVDGQQLDPTSFGVSDANGVWTPIKYTGTFGTNGFQLQFGNSAALGTDSSINGNDFTVNNLTSIDQTTDYPVNNFSTLNPLTSTASTLSEGNLKFVYASGTYSNGKGTLAVSQGKWYVEAKATTIAATNYPGWGIADVGTAWSSNPANVDFIGQDSQAYGFFPQLGVYTNSSLVLSITDVISSGDIIGLALDLDSVQNTLKIYQNGSLLDTANINPPNNAYIFGASINTSGSSAVTEFNFGNPPFTISSGNSDGNGYGNFEYAVPSGYYALCTKNLAEYG